MNKFFEDDVLEEIRDYVLYQLDEYSQNGVSVVNANELGWLVTEEINSNGSVTYSREEAYRFLSWNPKATETTIKYMIEALGEDPEDIYYPEDAEDDELDGTYEAYIKWNGEHVMSIMYISVAKDMVEMCPYIQQHWNDVLELREAAPIIAGQVRELDLDEIELCA